MVLILCGRAEDGLELCLKAVEANPRGLMNHRIMWHIALGHFVLGQNETAIEWAKRSDQQLLDVAPTLLDLTAAAAQAGQTEEANRAAARLAALHPDIAIETLRRWPFDDATVWERFTDGLRMAGLEGIRGQYI